MKDQVIIGEEVFFSVLGLSKALGVSKQTVYNWIRSGILSTRSIGRAKLIPEKDVIQVILGRKELVSSDILKVKREEGNE